MTLPQKLTSTEILRMVKETLEKSYDVEVLEQQVYTEKSIGLPSLKTKSLILFKDKKEKLYIAKTENFDIEIIDMTYFQLILEKLTMLEKEKFNGMLEKINEEKVGMSVVEKLKEDGFELLVEINNFYPLVVKSGIYTFKAIYYNEDTKEIKAIERKDVRSKIEYEKEISLDVIRGLKEDNPLRQIVEALESADMKKVLTIMKR